MSKETKTFDDYYWEIKKKRERQTPKTKQKNKLDMQTKQKFTFKTTNFTKNTHYQCLKTD